MKTKKEIKELEKKAYVAQQAYKQAIIENLMECGKELPILSDNAEFDAGQRLEVLNYDRGSDNWVVDKIRKEMEFSPVEVHICEFNYDEHDEWADISNMGDADEYVLQNIDWDALEG